FPELEFFLVLGTLASEEYEFLDGAIQRGAQLCDFRLGPVEQVRLRLPTAGIAHTHTLFRGGPRVDGLFQPFAGSRLQKGFSDVYRCTEYDRQVGVELYQHCPPFKPSEQPIPSVGDYAQAMRPRNEGRPCPP